MATWADLSKELAAWRAAGEVPTYWWRDDDAEAPSPALDRLLGLAEGRGVPIHLAVVPAGVTGDLAQRLAGPRDVQVLQHGFAHINHEPAGARASEIGEHRPLAAQLDDLRAGWARLQAADLPGLLPGLAPPWNRIGDRTVAALPSIGMRLLSTCHARKAREPVPGLLQVNIHVDPIRWKDGAAFRGEEAILHILVTHLAERRRGLADKDEPTGLSTHHLQCDAVTWDFIDALLDRLTHADAGRWVRLGDLLDRREDSA